MAIKQSDSYIDYTKPIKINKSIIFLMFLVHNHIHLTLSQYNISVHLLRVLLKNQFHKPSLIVLINIYVFK